MVVGMYFARHNINMPFFMPYFSRSNIITYHFHANEDESDTKISYEKIIGWYLMVNLG